jgi:hypothetical protein
MKAGKGIRLVNGFIEEHSQTFLNPFGNGGMRVDTQKVF